MIQSPKHPTAPQADAARIADLIERLARLVRRKRKTGTLNELQWQTLRFLALANRYSRHPGGLAAWLGVSKGAASQTVEALAKQGLILRLPDPRDGRALTLDLTNGGRRMAEKDPMLAPIAAFAALSAPALDATAETLTAALVAMQRGNGNRAFGLCRTCRYFRTDDAKGETGGPHRCGLTQEPLNAAETELICAEFESKDAA